MKKPRRTIREVCPETGTVTYYTVPARSHRDARQHHRHPPAPSKAQKAERRRREAEIYALAAAPAPPPKGRRPRNDNPVWQALKREVLAVGRCAHCSRTDQLTVDHIIPVVAGGTSDRHNLQCLCWTCNQAKADRLPNDYDMTLPQAA